MTNSKFNQIPRQLGAHLLHIESVQHTVLKTFNTLIHTSPPQAQNMTKWDFMHSSVSVLCISCNTVTMMTLLWVSDCYMVLNVLPGGPIGPGSPGGPGWPSDPVTGDPGGPRAPGIPGVPGSPGQSKHEDHIQSDHRLSVWAV